MSEHQKSDDKNKKQTDKQENKNEKKSSFWVKANITATLSLFAGITLSLLIFPRPTESHTERRDLAKFPQFSVADYFSGDFADGVTEWFDDTVPWRDGFKNISSHIVKYMGVSLGGATVYGPIQEIKPTSTQPPEPTQPTDTNQPTPPDNSDSPSTQPIEENTSATVTTEPEFHVGAGEMSESNGLVVYQNTDTGHYWCVQLYSGGYSQDTFIEYINTIADQIGDSAQVYVMVAPESSEYYTPDQYLDYTVSQKKVVDYINNGLSDKVIGVDCVEPLRQHAAEDIFCRTDHHWKPLGAYYAAKAFADAAGITILEDLSLYELRTIPKFIGTWYGSTQDPNLYNDYDTFDYYIPPNDFDTYYYDTAYQNEFKAPFFLQYDCEENPDSAYSTFMGADNKIVRVDTDVKNGKKLLVFKDSYGNAEIPFYMNSYEQIYVCDIRFFDLNAIDFIKEQGIDDVLFTMCITSATGDNAFKMEKLFTNP